MTYELGGEQYIAVLSGFGGANGLNVPYVDGAKVGQGRILAFKLDGTASLPPYMPAAPRPATVVKKEPDWTEATVREGATNYGNCVFCHGFSAISIGVVPDLRRSPIIADKEAFANVVLKGALESQGMPNLSNRVTPAQLETIRACLADRAHQLSIDDAVKAKAAAD